MRTPARDTLPDAVVGDVTVDTGCEARSTPPRSSSCAGSGSRTATRRCSTASTSPSTPGEHVVIFGPSGSGKSTLLRTINLLEEPNEGSVRVLGVEYGPGVGGAEREARRPAAAAPARRHGLPAVQSLPAPDGARQHRAPAALGEEDLARRSRSWPRRAGCSRSASSTGPRTTRRSSPAARRSGSRSPVRSASTRR